MASIDVRALRRFRHNSLFENESSGLACNGNARLLVEQAKKDFGLDGRILEVVLAMEEADVHLSHSYVVLTVQEVDELALNQQIGTTVRTVGDVRNVGKDITAEILSLPWDKLR